LPETIVNNCAMHDIAPLQALVERFRRFSKDDTWNPQRCRVLWLLH